MLSRTPVSESGESQPLVQIDRLNVAFDRRGAEPLDALRDVDLSIGRGEMVGLVGESGAGKTTLARAIMGLVPAPGRIVSGQVSFGGKPVSAPGAGAPAAVLGRDIAMVVPNPRSELNPVLTVGQQIANVVRAHSGKNAAEAREVALGMLKAVRIPDPERRLDAYVHELSGGMAQRVVIAIALCCSPSFVISDDATSGLDVTVQTQVLELLKAMVEDQGASALFITRDIAITAHFCSRIAILYAGELVEVADVWPFFERPAHPYSNMLLAAFAHAPELRRRWVPDTIEPPVAGGGCAFAPRCPNRRPLCETLHPPLATIAPGHAVRCHYPVLA